MLVRQLANMLVRELVRREVGATLLVRQLVIDKMLARRWLLIRRW